MNKTELLALADRIDREIAAEGRFVITGVDAKDAITALRRLADAAAEPGERDCEICGGDCASANPPIAYCPVKERKQSKEAVEKAREMLRLGINIQATGDATNAVVTGVIGSLLDHIDDLDADLKCAIAVGRMAHRPQPAPAFCEIKPLEWDDNLRADVYSINDSFGQGRKKFYMARGSSIIGWFDEELAAKAAAQADYERRIRSALTQLRAPDAPQADQNAERMRDALIALDERLRACGSLFTAEDAYDSFYQEIVSEALTASRGADGKKSDGGKKEAAVTEDQIKYMVDRFLSWKLPRDTFNPDCGISFDKKPFNAHTPHPMLYEPSGTNLFDAEQATAMVRYMIDGMTGPPDPADVTVEVKPLEWRQYPDGDTQRYEGIAVVGNNYAVFKAWWGAQNKWGWIGEGEFYHSDIEARRACNADYERRILSALTVGRR